MIITSRKVAAKRFSAMPLAPRRGERVGLEVEALASELLELEKRKSELERWITFLAVGDTWIGCNDGQILGVTKRRGSRIRNIKSTLHVLVAAAKPKLEGWGFVEGDPIIYLENSYQKEFWKRLTGRIVPQRG